MRYAHGLLIVTLGALGCASVEPTGVPPQHVVFVDTYGHLVDPTGALKCNERATEHVQVLRQKDNYPDASRLDWNPCFGDSTLVYRRTVESIPAYFEDMFAEMAAFHSKAIQQEEALSGTATSPVKRKLTVVVHGGLAGNTGNLELSRDVAPSMRAAGQYPVFISWQSNLWGSLVDAYFKVWNGRNRGWGLWSVLAPFKLMSDVVTGVTRLPSNLYSHFSREVARSLVPLAGQRGPADASYAALRHRYDTCRADDDCEEIAISRGEWDWKTKEGYASARRNLTFTFLLPTKLLSMPFIEGPGTAGWDAMLRHVQISFRNEDGQSRASTWNGWPETNLPDCGDASEFAADTVGEREWGGAGAVSVFFRRLRQEIRCNGGPSQWEITLIGHSMGTIMVNEILRHFSDIKFSNIVYMAAACSIEDYENSVIPYLQRHANDEEPPTMWHLTLHPFADLREEYAAGTVPSGSLLVWIDDYLADPSHFRGRTAGRYDNLMLALPYTPEKLRPMIHAKTFGVGSNIACENPQKHGGFFKFDGCKEQREQECPMFWSKDFWQPIAPRRAGPDKERLGKKSAVPGTSSDRRQ